jgi:hypothetical protein
VDGNVATALEELHSKAKNSERKLKLNM